MLGMMCVMMGRCVSSATCVCIYDACEGNESDNIVIIVSLLSDTYAYNDEYIYDDRYDVRWSVCDDSTHASVLLLM